MSSGLVTISYYAVSTFASSILSEFAAIYLKHNRWASNAKDIQPTLSTDLAFSLTETYDPDVPLNLSKPTNIWSPARSIEQQSPSYSAPNLSILKQESSSSIASAQRRIKRESRDDPTKVFPVSVPAPLWNYLPVIKKFVFLQPDVIINLRSNYSQNSFKNFVTRIFFQSKFKDLFSKLLQLLLLLLQTFTTRLWFRSQVTQTFNQL